MEAVDYRDIKVHPLFDPLKKIFEFAIFGNWFMMQPQLQEIFLNMHPEAKCVIDDYNNLTNPTPKGSQIHTNIQPYLIYTGRLIAIAIFDILQFSKYNKYLSRTDIFKFARHIRNGTAHNNKFFFTEKVKQELSKNPVKWDDKTINASLAGKTVVPDFINIFSLLFLMRDISKMMEAKNTAK